MNKSFYVSSEWRALRYKVLLQYGKKCMLCNSTDSVMHVDHIKPVSLHPELKLEFMNLQVLCEDCNIGKSNKDQTDLRPIEDVPIVKVFKTSYIALRSGGVAHVWNGIDTACKLYSKNNWSIKKFTTSTELPKTRNLCRVCGYNTGRRT